MTLFALSPDAPSIANWEVWAPHTWAPWLSIRVFRAFLFFLGAFLLDRVWRGILKRALRAALKREAENPQELARRLDTLSAVGRRIGSSGLYIAAFLITLADFGVQVGPLLAGLGIAGVAVGFGAQYLVRDMINGFFIVAEDQFRVGDSIKVGDFSGSVDSISLRTTRLRGVAGDLITLPNGEIKAVVNYSRQWSRAIVDAGVARECDLGAVFLALREAGARARAEESLTGLFLEPPEVVGVTEISEGSVKVRLWAKVTAGRQWEVERGLRRAIHEVFAERQILAPVQHREVALSPECLDALRPGKG